MQNMRHIILSRTSRNQNVGATLAVSLYWAGASPAPTMKIPTKKSKWRNTTSPPRHFTTSPLLINKVISRLLLTIILCSIGTRCLAQFAGGIGTKGAPWQVSSAEQLNHVRNYLGEEHSDKYFIQTADINLDRSPWNDDEGWLPIGEVTFNDDGQIIDDNRFYGNYNGNDRTINGLYINRPEDNYQGLFGITNGSKINRVRLTNVDITGYDIVGGLAASNYNYSEINNSYSDGRVIGMGRLRSGGLVGENRHYSLVNKSISEGIVGGSSQVGGLVGWNHDNSVISFCYSLANVAGVGNNIGGLAGLNSELSNVTNSYSRGNVEGDLRVGGLVGSSYSSSIISYSYSTGFVTGEGMTGGLIAMNTLSQVINCYWDVESSGQQTSASGCGKSSDEMQDITTFAAWDFNLVWQIEDGYPELIMDFLTNVTEERVYVEWNADPTTTMVINWHSLSEDSRLIYREVGTKLWHRVSGFSMDFEQRSEMVHRVFLSGLKPDTEYKFRVSECIVEADKTYKFKTMPSSLERDLRIVFAGDSRSNWYRDSDNWFFHLNRKIRDLEPDFIVGKGDYVPCEGRVSRTNSNRWVRWLDHLLSEIILADGTIIPFLPGWGNHEVDPGRAGSEVEDYYYLDLLFAFPNGENPPYENNGYGVLEFGDYLQLIFLDTNHRNDIEPQTEWLEEIMAPEKFTHVIPTYHSALYPSRKSFGSNPSDWKVRGRRQWTPLFQENNVKIVMEACDHTWKKTVPIRMNDENIDGYEHPDGIIFCGDGGWGAPMRDVVHYSEWWIDDAAGTDRRPDDGKHIWQTTLSDYRLKLESINFKGKVFDTFTIPVYTPIRPEGEGTGEDPFLVSSLENLYWIRRNDDKWDRHYYQISDICASETSLWYDGGWSPIGNENQSFTGNYDANGYTIDGVYIDRPEADYQGLFGIVEEAVISKLRLTNVTITGSSYVGGISGYNYSNSTINHCHVSGNINAADYIGGITGKNSGSSITNSYSLCNINGTGVAIGALVGKNEKTGVIENCFSRGDVSGNSHVGGLVGSILTDSRIVNCYSTGFVEGYNNIGGLLGYSSNSIVINSYWDVNLSGQDYSEEGEGRTTDDMTYPFSEDTFVEWSFNEVWASDEQYTMNDGYPHLIWQVFPHPKVALNPSPEDNSLSIPVYLEELGWSYKADDDYTDPVGFRIYFDETGEFEAEEYVWVPYLNGQEDYSTGVPQKLSYSTVYYWKVVPTTVDPGRNWRSPGDLATVSELDKTQLEDSAEAAFINLRRVKDNTHNLQFTTHNSQLTNHCGGDAYGCPVWSFKTETDTSVEPEPQFTTELRRNFPNPFNNNTLIRYSLKEKDEVELKIYNVLGKKVKTLDKGSREPGVHTIEWNGTNSSGKTVASGVYIYRFKTTAFDRSRKMIYLK